MEWSRTGSWGQRALNYEGFYMLEELLTLSGR